MCIIYIPGEVVDNGTVLVIRNEVVTTELKVDTDDVIVDVVVAMTVVCEAVIVVVEAVVIKFHMQQSNSVLLSLYFRSWGYTDT